MKPARVMVLVRNARTRRLRLQCVVKSSHPACQAGSQLGSGVIGLAMMPVMSAERLRFADNIMNVTLQIRPIGVTNPL